MNQPAVLRRAQQIQARRTVKKEWQVRPPLGLRFPVRGSPLKAAVLNFAQDASNLKRLQLSTAYFNNSYTMMMGWRKITHLSKQVKSVITLEWQSRKWFWGIFIHECIQWHLFSTHLFSFLDIPSFDVFYFNFQTVTSKPGVPTVEALRRPPLTILFSFVLIFINHVSKFRKMMLRGVLVVSIFSCEYQPKTCCASQD